MVVEATAVMVVAVVVVVVVVVVAAAVVTVVVVVSDQLRRPRSLSREYVAKLRLSKDCGSSRSQCSSEISGSDRVPSFFSSLFLFLSLSLSPPLLSLSISFSISFSLLLFLSFSLQAISTRFFLPIVSIFHVSCCVRLSAFPVEFLQEAAASSQLLPQPSGRSSARTPHATVTRAGNDHLSRPSSNWERDRATTIRPIDGYVRRYAPHASRRLVAIPSRSS